MEGDRRLLTLIPGRAGTGKTVSVMNDIKRRMDSGETGLLLVVPEQYTHDAERQLCAVCGDRLSMHGETLSFTGLYRLVFSQTGGVPADITDAAGALLIMSRAFGSVAPRLRVFGAKKQRVELLEMLLSAVNEFKSLCIAPERLLHIAAHAGDRLADKLRDLAIIYDAYDALMKVYGGDKSDRLTSLAEMIGGSTIGDSGHIYFDGFVDFTAQEMRVIEALLQKDADMTVCLTCDLGEDLSGSLSSSAAGSEIFDIPRKTAGRLRRLAEEYGVEVMVVAPGGLADADMAGAVAAGADEKAPELIFLEKYLFEHSPVKYRTDEPPRSGANGTPPADEPASNTAMCTAPRSGALCAPFVSTNPITIYAAATRYSECEHAAYKVNELVRSGYRWRDIGVMARNWEDYGPVCETVFEKYGVPFFSGGKTDIHDKPPVSFIEAALEIAASGWEYKPVFRYLKTGLSDIGAVDCSLLENYVVKWSIRGAAWTREWTLQASGFGGDKDEATLESLNTIRDRVTSPLIRLHEGIKGDTAVSVKLSALYGFLEEAGFSERLRDRSELLEKRGELRLAGEYRQLGGIIIGAMEQMLGILGDTRLSASEFIKLFSLMTSQYDVGVIPVALDRTALGGMAMSRRRHLKCLIILGATDSNLPMLSKSGGALSDSERVEMTKLGADMPAGLEDRLCREMNMLYSTITLPSSQLVITYTTEGGERPSFIVKRIKTMFGITETTLPEEEYKTAAERPCFELAALAGCANNSPMAAAARNYFIESPGEKRDLLIEVDARRHAGRGGLSPDAAALLYGRGIKLSATRLERYYSCAYKHFLHSGLKLDPMSLVNLATPAAGVYVHYILDNVSSEIKATTGFKNTDEQICRSLVRKYTDDYIRDVLSGFDGLGARFQYLFRRLEEEVERIVLDMLGEMKHSDFEPLGFELDLSELATIAGEDEITKNDSEHPELRGSIDRVDGWRHDGKMFLRIVDYKTYDRAFSLSDVLYGIDMQMLIYLFELQRSGRAMFGAPIEPAGVLYVPALDPMLKEQRTTPDEKLTKKRKQKLRRTGLVLDDPIVIEAMENGDEKKYLPVRPARGGGLTGDSLVSSRQMELLSEHVDRMLRNAATRIMSGDIDCCPFYKNAETNACKFCDFKAVCRFDENSGDRAKFARKLKSGDVWKALEGR